MDDSMTKAEWIDPDDAPELDDDWFDRAELRIGDRVLRPARSAGTSMIDVSLRLDTEVLNAFRAEGPGWQTRMNDALRKAAGV